MSETEKSPVDVSVASGSANHGGEKILGDKLFYLALAVSSVFLSLTLWFDFGSDQALYYYLAWAWKKYHMLPYAGVYSGDLPGIIIIHRLAIDLFGESALGFRFFDFLAQLSSAAMIYFFAKKLSRSSWAGLMAGAIYSIFYYGLHYFGGERDSFVFWMLMLAATAGLVMKDGSFLRVTVVGLLLGCCLLTKPPFGLCWAVFGLWFLAEGIRPRPLRIWIELSVFVFSCFLPALIFVFIYWRLGYLKILYTETLWLQMEVYSHIKHLSLTGKLARSALTIFSMLGYYPVIMSAGVLGFLAMLVREKSPEERKVFWIVLGLIATCVACLLMQIINMPYHRAPPMGLISIFAGCGVAVMGEQLKPKAKPWLGKVAPLILYGAIISALFFSTEKSVINFSMKYAFRNLDRAYKGSQDYSMLVNNMWNQRQVAEYLKPLLRPGDQVEVFGCYPFLSCLLNRKPVNSFPSVYNLLMRHSDGVYRPQQLKWIEEYSEAVIKARPRFFIIASICIECEVHNWNMPETTLQKNMQVWFPALYDFFSNNYKLINQVGELEIYEWETGKAE